MGQTILTKDQEAVLALIGRDKDIAPIFYLSGGTALAAFYLQHRYSDDLDFFTNAGDFPQITVERIAQEIQHAVGAEKIEYQRLYDRRIFFFKKSGGDDLKLEFTFYPFAHIHPPTKQGGMLIDSVDDLAANKVMATVERHAPKDVVDLYFLMTKKGYTLDTLLARAKKKFGLALNPSTLIGEILLGCRNLHEIQTMLLGSLKEQKKTLDCIQDYFKNMSSDFLHRQWG